MPEAGQSRWRSARTGRGGISRPPRTAQSRHAPSNANIPASCASGSISCGIGRPASFANEQEPRASPGTRAPTPQRARPPTPCPRGCTFAEHPDLQAPQARIIWHANFDPGTIGVTAFPADPADPDSIRINRIAPWLDIAIDEAGREHAVLSDGWHHIRLDIEECQLAGQAAVLLHYRILGLASAEARLLPLRRFLDLCRDRRFARSLFPRDARIDRGIEMLRVHDAICQGASQREIGAALFGEERVRRDWSDGSDSLRSRVRRRVREAGAMARGRYRQLMRRRP